MNLINPRSQHAARPFIGYSAKPQTRRRNADRINGPCERGSPPHATCQITIHITLTTSLLIVRRRVRTSLNRVAPFEVPRPVAVTFNQLTPTHIQPAYANLLECDRSALTLTLARFTPHVAGEGDEVWCRRAVCGVRCVAPFARVDGQSLAACAVGASFWRT